jgi:general secretion pathway protein J
MTARARGFTLLELLVALAIFAVLAVLGYGGVRNLLRLEAGVTAAAERHERLKFALLMLEQDLGALAPRSVRDGLGEPEAALVAGIDGELLTLTRRVPELLDATRAPGLDRVRYRLDAGRLYREVWMELDRTPATERRSRRLLNEVSALRLRFYSDGEWREFWPPQAGAEALDTLPAGIEFVLEFSDRQSLRRLVMRPG